MGIKIVVSTDNKNKLREIKDILKDLPVEVISKSEASIPKIEIVEDKDTLEGNSLKKAETILKYTNSYVLADDSGLFVDALDGAPGVYSARYAGEDGNDYLNNIKLLEELKNISDDKRTAKFKCTIALVGPNDIKKIAYGECKGVILKEKRGDNGFGYDPLFMPVGYDKSFAELDGEIKNKISHRSNALKELRKIIKDLIKEDENENLGNK